VQFDPCPPIPVFPLTPSTRVTPFPLWDTLCSVSQTPHGTFFSHDFSNQNPRMVGFGTILPACTFTSWLAPSPNCEVVSPPHVEIRFWTRVAFPRNPPRFSWTLIFGPLFCYLLHSISPHITPFRRAQISSLGLFFSAFWVQGPYSCTPSPLLPVWLTQTHINIFRLWRFVSKPNFWPVLFLSRDPSTV